MGFISERVSKGISLDSHLGEPRQDLLARDQGRHIWEQVFGNVTRQRQEAYRSPPVRGGSYGRSIFSQDASIKRLLQSMRSMAPGGWSDDRYEESRHFVGINYVCIHRTSEQLSLAEFQVFKKDRSHPDGKRPITEQDPPEGGRFVRPYDLVKLLEKPNLQDSFGDLMYRWNQQMSLTGKALTWMVPNALGIPMELYSIPTAMAIPQPAVNPDFPDGYYRIQPIYPYGPFSSYPTPATAVGAPIPAQWMMDFKFPHPILRYDGYSPQTGLRFHIDEVETMDRSRWYSMKRTFNPSAVLDFKDMEGMQPLPEEEIERIRAEWENEFQGAENVGRIVVGTPGAELKEWGQRPVDMDYQGGWDQLTSFVMGGFGITKPVAGMVEDASYAALFATLKQFHLLTLNPLCNRFAQKLTRFLAPFYGDDLIVEIRCKRIDDHDVQNGKLELLMQARAITKNEMRKELDIPLTEEAWGEEIAGQEPPQEGEGGETMLPGLLGGNGAPPAPAGGKEGESATPLADQDKPVDARSEIPELARSRPRVEPLNDESLGKRKSLNLNNKAEQKSLYDSLRKVLQNGNGHAA